MPLYFAYGSNLDEARLRQRCGEAVPLIDVGSLPGYRLEFTAHSETWGGGVADVVEFPGERVWGLVFELSDGALRALDQYEGVPDHYRRFKVNVDTRAGSREAWVYAVVSKRDSVPPSRRYLEILKSAAARHGFPGEYARKLDKVSVADA